MPYTFRPLNLSIRISCSYANSNVLICPICGGLKLPPFIKKILPGFDLLPYTIILLICSILTIRATSVVTLETIGACGDTIGAIVFFNESVNLLVTSPTLLGSETKLSGSITDIILIKKFI